MKINNRNQILHGEEVRGLWLLVTVFLVIIYFIVPRFFTLSNLSNVVVRSLPLFFVAVGQMMVLLTGGIDLSVGSVISLSTCIAAKLMDIGINVWVAILVCLFAGIFIGLLNGFAVSKLKIEPFIVTIGTNSIASGLALLIMSSPGGIIYSDFAELVTGDYFGLPLFGLIIFIFISLIFYFLLHRSFFGLKIYAVGGNEHNSLLAGLNTDKIKLIVYGISGLMASFGGLCLAARMYCGDPLCGKAYLLDSVAVAVLGGTALSGGKGGILGVLAGLLIIAPLSNILNLFGINAYYQYVIKGVILVLIVASSKFDFSWKPAFFNK